MTAGPEILHATAISIERRGVLIIGPSGAGKSALALQLLALGAELISDDRTVVQRNGDTVRASAPEPITGKIEARGVGILKVGFTGPTRLALVVDLSHIETKRLPEPHVHSVAGVMLPCLHKVENTSFPSAVLLYMKAGTTNLL